MLKNNDQTDEELFKKYEKAFGQRKVEDMITVKKEWHRRHPGEKFHPAYVKRVKKISVGIK